LDDNFPRAARATVATRRLDFLLAHRPGFILPTLAVRKLATLNQFTGGRPRVHFVTGRGDAEPQRDGDCLAHDERHARTDEYLDILRRVCTSPTPIDHAGAHYRFAAAFSELKPLQVPHIPISFGGTSDPAIDVAARHAGLYVLWGETLEGTRELVTRVCTAAAADGCDPGFSIPIRAIVACAISTSSIPAASPAPGCRWATYPACAPACRPSCAASART
jgi:alkanesulfonate monooxygenase